MIILQSNAYGFDAELNIDKETYTVGENISAHITLTNQMENATEYEISYSFGQEDTQYTIMYPIITETLDSGETKDINIPDILTDENYPEGIYTLSVTVMNENDYKTINNNITIEGGLKEFEYELRSCLDKDCNYESIVFLDTETIYIIENTDTKDLSVSSQMFYPGGKSIDIDIPYQFKPSEEGIYEVNAIVTKEGYKENIISIRFSVLKDDPEIETINYCNNDGICDIEDESHSTCPSDCPSGIEDGYCDGIEDDVCDPDCTSVQDPDCSKEDNKDEIIDQNIKDQNDSKDQEFNQKKTNDKIIDNITERDYDYKYLLIIVGSLFALIVALVYRLLGKIRE